MTQQHIQKVYSFYSQFYDLLFGSILEEGRKNLFKIANFQSHHQILEVGIGTGITLRRYPPSCLVHGLDISEKMLQKAKSRSQKPRYRQQPLFLSKADAAKIPYKEESFDVVLGCYVLTTVENPESVLKEMIRVTKKNGRIFLLNHFMSEQKGMRHKLERKFSPLFYRMGFRTDLDLDFMEAIDGIEKEKELTVNLLKLHKIIQLRKKG